METAGAGPNGRRVDHVAVAVWDADAAAAWWEGRLGLPRLHDEELPEVGVRLLYLDAGGTMLQLVQPVGSGPVADFLAARGEGLHHLCFAVTGIPDELARLDEAGATVFPGGRGRRCCFLNRQPNQVLIELTEHQAVGRVAP